jgi:transcriptional regulator with XRE-family HTH domain
MLGTSQEKLADAFGLTFQQVQKYEKGGTNRISASRLQQAADTLGVARCSLLRPNCATAEAWAAYSTIPRCWARCRSNDGRHWRSWRLHVIARHIRMGSGSHFPAPSPQRLGRAPPNLAVA